MEQVDRIQELFDFLAVMTFFGILFVGGAALTYGVIVFIRVWNRSRDHLYESRRYNDRNNH